MQRYSLSSLCLLVLWMLPSACFAQQKVALLVGISNYSDARMNAMPLKYPEADAAAIAEVLKQSDYRVVILVGKQATAKAIRQAFEELQKQGDQPGVLLLGFFGHGVQYGESAYYCPFDTSMRAVKDKDGNILREANDLPRQEPDPASMIAMREMLDVLALSPAGNKLLLADCCREDPSRARGGLRGRAFGTALRVDQLPKNCAAMFACSEGEQAFEHDEWLHGAFTKAILESLSKPGRVTANGLSESVYFGVEQLVKSKGQQQRVNSLLAGGIVDLKLKSERAAKPDMRSQVPSAKPENKANADSSLPRSFVNSIGATMVFIPAGTFTMGSPSTETNREEDEKQHEVTITKDYYLGKTEVTQGQWRAVMGTRPWQGEPLVKEGDNYPATFVSWEDAVEFCRKLSAKEGKSYRLPTEAEWEHSCRAGTTTAYSFGADSTRLGEHGWWGGIVGGGNAKDEPHAHEVGGKQANRLGLHDMHGNVHEWCSDWYAGEYYASSPAVDPTGPPTGSVRVSRGGSWDYDASLCRSAVRGGFSPGFCGSFLGFRVALVSSK